MKKFLVLIFTLFTVVTNAQSGITFYTGNVEALFQKAKRENKYIFVDTYTPWCKPCKKMDVVFRDPAVSGYFNGNFINIKVNMDEGNDANYIRNNYQVVFLPTLLIIDPNGNQMFKADRIISANELLKAGERALHPERYQHEIAQRYSTRLESAPTAVVRNAPPASTPRYTSTVSTQPTTAYVSRPETKYTQRKAPTSRTTGPTSSPGTVRSHTGATVRAPREVVNATPKRRQIAKPARRAYSDKTVNKNSPVSKPTANKEEGKIVKMVDNDHLADDPNILKEEAYYRLTRMDGSHKDMAHKYLATQKNWSSDINMQFLMDFTEDVNTKEFDYIAKNKKKFVEKFGVSKVDRLLSVAVYRRLHQGLPRATKEVAQQLYTKIGVKNPKAYTYHYYLPLLMDQNNNKLLAKEAKGYFKKNPGDVTLAKRVVTYISKNPVAFTKKDLVFFTDVASRLVKYEPKNSDAKDKLLKLYIGQNKCREAKILASKMEETDTSLSVIRKCK